LIVAAEPATPDDLREAANDVTTAYQKLATNYLAEVSQSELDSTIHASDDASTKIDALCK
jgi:hypothetical protein